MTPNPSKAAVRFYIWLFPCRNQSGMEWSWIKKHLFCLFVIWLSCHQFCLYSWEQSCLYSLRMQNFWIKIATLLDWSFLQKKICCVTENKSELVCTHSCHNHLQLWEINSFCKFYVFQVSKPPDYTYLIRNTTIYCWWSKRLDTFYKHFCNVGV